MRFETETLMGDDSQRQQQRQWQSYNWSSSLFSILTFKFTSILTFILTSILTFIFASILTLKLTLVFSPVWWCNIPCLSSHWRSSTHFGSWYGFFNVFIIMYAFHPIVFVYSFRIMMFINWWAAKTRPQKATTEYPQEKKRGKGRRRGRWWWQPWWRWQPWWWQPWRW